MKIPEGYALVKVSEIPGMIRESIRTVMKQRRIVFAELGPSYAGHGGSDWHPLYNGQEKSNAILIEMGNNATQPIVLSGEATSIEEVDRLREALDYLRRKVDGYDTTFEMAEAMATNAPCHGCSHTYHEHPNDSGCQFWHSRPE